MRKDNDNEKVDKKRSTKLKKIGKKMRKKMFFL